jgi:uncharacterized protein with FMN-binding domain
MKKHMSRNTLVMVLLDIVLGVVLSLYIANTGTMPAADNAVTYTDGTYTASAKGCLSDVAVTVTITGGKVTNVDIDASGETPELGGKAAESLTARLKEAGSTAGVDAVTGSTMTSDAVFAAMDDCLAQAAQ